MRIYAVADVHSQQEKFEIIKSNINNLKPDVLVIAGDITNYFSPDIFIKQLNELEIPVLAVRGNADLKKVDNLLFSYPNTIALGLIKSVSINNITFIGLSGAIPFPFYSIICLKEKKAFKKIEKITNLNSILVVHPPPRGTLDNIGKRFYSGSIQLRNFIRKYQPGLVICGHIHENAGFEYINKTLVINCAMNKYYNGAIIEFKNKTKPIVKMVSI